LSSERTKPTGDDGGSASQQFSRRGRTERLQMDL
jgi:hypothetical protein